MSLKSKYPALFRQTGPSVQVKPPASISALASGGISASSAGSSRTILNSGPSPRTGWRPATNGKTTRARKHQTDFFIIAWGWIKRRRPAKRPFIRLDKRGSNQLNSPRWIPPAKKTLPARARPNRMSVLYHFLGALFSLRQRSRWLLPRAVTRFRKFLAHAFFSQLHANLFRQRLSSAHRTGKGKLAPQLGIFCRD